jgi:hypothetical protein
MMADRVPGWCVQLNNCQVEMTRRDFFAGRWQSYLEHALTLKPNYSGTTDGGSVVTDIVAKVALGQYSGSGETSGKVRGHETHYRYDPWLAAHQSNPVPPIGLPKRPVSLHPTEAASSLHIPSGCAKTQTRLRDAIVFGYNLARAPHKVSEPLEVPSWYTQGLTPACAPPLPPPGAGGLSAAVRIGHGSTHNLPDTLVSLRDTGKAHALPERRAAAGLFE